MIKVNHSKLTLLSYITKPMKTFIYYLHYYYLALTKLCIYQEDSSELVCRWWCRSTPTARTRTSRRTRWWPRGCSTSSTPRRTASRCRPGTTRSSEEIIIHTYQGVTEVYSSEVTLSAHGENKDVSQWHKNKLTFNQVDIMRKYNNSCMYWIEIREEWELRSPKVRCWISQNE